MQLAETSERNGDELFAEFMRTTVAMRNLPPDHVGGPDWANALRRQQAAFANWSLYLQDQATTNVHIRRLRSMANRGEE